MQNAPVAGGGDEDLHTRFITVTIKVCYVLLSVIDKTS